jgi:hypothetical protein
LAGTQPAGDTAAALRIQAGKTPHDGSPTG